MLNRLAIRSRAQALIRALDTSKGARQKIILKDINELANDYPQSGEIFRGRINELLRWTQDSDGELSLRAHQTLALIGHPKPPKSCGLRILSIDGGGIRGIVSLEILRHIEKSTNKRIHELFDLICGVSSGAIITMGIGSGKFTLDQCESFYRDMSENIFKTDFWSSTPRLLLNHAYYDAAIFESVLKKAFGKTSLMALAGEADLPKLVAVSINAHSVQPFLFRTYAQNPLVGNKFEGTCKAEIWQAIRASSAAPGYFQEYKFGDSILLDGAMLVNNCSGVAHSEARLLWPNEQVQCFVSVGSGKFKPIDMFKANATSLYEKVHGLVYSATDTETIHTIMQNVVENYYRLNPQLSENILISENRKMKLDQLRQESRQYMISNEVMINQLAKKLTQPRQFYKRLIENYWTKAH